MSDEIDDMYDTFSEMLDKWPPAETVKRLEQFGIDAEKIELIRERHEQKLARIRELEEPQTVVRGNRDTWYTGPRPGDRCWPALERSLQDRGWSDASIKSLDESSSRVVSLLDHPREPAFSTRGLALGYVQSGKTTNFTAVMAKAADRGYKLFIVLSGIHNGLRRQTQARLVSELVEPNPDRWSQLTNLDHDFVPPANAASFFGNSNKTRVLCVVKKNATVLRKLAKWLEGAESYLEGCPALIIDDEADQATVATKSINPLIRRIMAGLPRSAYIGYTASPFANLLIDPSADDLYPQDFIVNLPKPVGHFGTEVLFGRYALDGEDPSDIDDGHDMIRTVPWTDIEHVRPSTRAEVDGFTPEITETLRRAVLYFWLVVAARRVRGTGNPHNTMLIHTSVNTSVHNSFRAPLEELRAEVRDAIDDPSLLEELRVLWEKETGRVLAEEFGETAVPFDALLTELPGVLGSCRVIMDNSSSQDRLDYENGPLVAIAVGGNTLSRGLTLEGLSVSYFVRAVSAYDTLLQMGRWFGFRNGYADLPRIWMTDELSEWFRHLATVETEMRRDIDVYLHNPNENPLTFAVRLRTHPSLQVTAAAKMKSAVKAVSSYGGARVQTHCFRTDAPWLGQNLAAARELISQITANNAVAKEDRSSDGSIIFRDVPYDVVLNFLGEYQFHEGSGEKSAKLARENNAKLITEYIQKRVRGAGALRRWNVAVIGRPPKGPDSDLEFAPGVTVGRVTRAKLATGSQGFADIKTLMSRKDAGIDLEGEISSMTEHQLRDARRVQLPTTGLLTLYPIDRYSEPVPAKKQRQPLDAEEHVIGVGLVFPEPDGPDSAVEPEYVSADLSGVQLEDFEEEEMLRLIEGEDA
ncbi:Z1 domain-containing protein [Streptomyces xanthii]|uniref:Z1 domain-containing protein n=1 Tax=Streptomyces xanthii TaxID=2768069 RepID=A0A7H1BB93_9ACTN|nr:Z1 domain-containing protein [Streptomyces xanthii]QNS05998.1 Z1 domain-containing protein [Streptomyces xanthii]